MLPAQVMKKAQKELLNWDGLGTSVMEVSHRSSEFKKLAKQADQDLRELMSIPDNYHVLFMHGGGRAQFAAVVNNFLGSNGKALYLTSGQWSQAAAEEAIRLVGPKGVDTIDVTKNEVEPVVKSISIPDFNNMNDEYRYLHFCPNETVDGIEIFDDISSPWPIVADMSSNILSRQIDVSRYAVIYAGAQKNIGPSGLSIVIIRNDMLKLPKLPQASIFNYQMQVESGSMYNTPPTFAWYLAAEVFKWLKQNGGVAQIEENNYKKAELLYDCIDNSNLYVNDVAIENRSWMNVTFKLTKGTLETEFIEQAKNKGLVALKGHRLVGGMRASIYNAMPVKGVQALTKFMVEFEESNTNYSN